MKIGSVVSLVGIVAGLCTPFKIGEEIRKEHLISEFLLNAKPGEFVSCYENNIWNTTQLFGNQLMSIGSNGNLLLVYNLENRAVNIKFNGYVESIKVPSTHFYKQIDLSFGIGATSLQANTGLGDSTYISSILLIGDGENIFVSVPANSTYSDVDSINLCPSVDSW